jgi:hypothetical protein
VKLPFDFATKLILRLVLPGAILTATLWPLVSAGLIFLGVSFNVPLTAAVSIMLLGWLTLLLDMPIYMFFEGRRFWPERLRKWGIGRESARLQSIVSKSSSAQQAGQSALELDLQTLSFPLGANGEPEARYPTRLGNLITAFEEYPLRKYGLDGTFVWPRLLVSIDKDLRSELDDQQAVADSALYVTAALVVVSICCIVYAFLAATYPSGLPALPSSETLAAVSAASAALAYGLYRLSLFRQAQYGDMFAATFDQHRSKIDWSSLAKDLTSFMGDNQTTYLSPQDINRGAVRFLKWHQYRKIGTTKNETVRGW